MLIICLFSSSAILNDFCRSVSKVHDEWFADEERVRRAVGLLEKPVAQLLNNREVNNLYCVIEIKTFVYAFSF